MRHAKDLEIFRGWGLKEFLAALGALGPKKGITRALGALTTGDTQSMMISALLSYWCCGPMVGTLRESGGKHLARPSGPLALSIGWAYKASSGLYKA